VVLVFFVSLSVVLVRGDAAPVRPSVAADLMASARETHESPTPARRGGAGTPSPGGSDPKLAAAPAVSVEAKAKRAPLAQERAAENVGGCSGLRQHQRRKHEHRGAQVRRTLASTV